MEATNNGAVAHSFVIMKAGDQVKDTALPLKAQIEARVFEPGNGRATKTDKILPLRTREAYIGIRPVFEGRYAQEGVDTQFDLVAVDAEGRAIALPSVDYKIERVVYSYQWYQQDGRWRWRCFTGCLASAITRGNVVYHSGDLPFWLLGALVHDGARVEMIAWDQTAAIYRAARAGMVTGVLLAVARKALKRKTGARGLRTILEQVLLDTMYELPSLEQVPAPGPVTHIGDALLNVLRGAQSGAIAAVVLVSDGADNSPDFDAATLEPVFEPQEQTVMSPEWIADRGHYSVVVTPKEEERPQ